MAKKLFKNYTFEFTTNERKILKTFCKQAINQMSGNNDYMQDVKAFESIYNKLESEEDSIKLTKNEKTRLVYQFKANVQNLEKQMEKSWFLKKWFLKSMYNQYRGIIDNHFND